MQENPMHAIKIEKLTLNVGCGNDHEKIERAKKLLEMLSSQKSIITVSKTRSTFGIPKGKPLGVKVTLRKAKAEEFFKKVLQSLDNKLESAHLDKYGNINIGIKEYIDLPQVKYSHDIGMLGLNCSITLQRPGYSIKRRRIQTRNISSKSKIYKEEVVSWLKGKGVQIE